MMDDKSVYPPAQPAGSVPPRHPKPPTFEEATFLSVTDALAEYAFRIDARIKSMFEEAFNAGQNFEEWGEPYPDFETWFAAALERWRDA